MLQSSLRRQKEQPACSSAVPEAILLACSYCIEFCSWVTGVLQGTCLYLCLPFYEAPRKKYKPHMGKILPIAPSWTSFCVVGETTLTHTHTLPVCTALNFSIFYNISLLSSCCTLLPVHCWRKKASDTLPANSVLYSLGWGPRCRAHACV